MQEAGLTFRLVDQGATLGGTIANYPRQKLVMTETVDLPYFGKFGRPLISKEDLMEMFTTALRKAEVKIQHGVKVSGVDGADGNFEVVTENERIKCQKVVLAIGRMGTPRKLEVPGEDLPKVTYSSSIRRSTPERRSSSSAGAIRHSKSPRWSPHKRGRRSASRTGPPPSEGPSSATRTTSRSSSRMEK